MGLVCDESGVALSPGDEVYGVINADMGHYKIVRADVIAKIAQSERGAEQRTSDKGLNVYLGSIRSSPGDGEEVVASDTVRFYGRGFLFSISWETARRVLPIITGKVSQRLRPRRLV